MYIREARVVTTRTIPVQVDGEAVRLNPCTIEITHLNKVWIQIDQSDATSDVPGSDPGQEEGKKEDVWAGEELNLYILKQMSN